MPLVVVETVRVAPLSDACHPGRERVAVDGVLVRLEALANQREHVAQHEFGSTDDRHLDRDDLGNRSRIDVDVNNLRTRRELGRIIRDAVIEARTDRTMRSAWCIAMLA